MAWKDVPFSAKLLTNVQEAAIRRASAAIENCYSNEQGGFTRFPGLSAFTTLTGAAPTYLSEWRGDLIAASNSRLWRIRKDGTAEDVTGAPIRGSGRVNFARADNEIAMAAGGEIIRFAGVTSEILSPDAPVATHLAYIDTYLVACETESGRFYHSSDDTRTWDPLDVFAADGTPDNINSMLVTPYRELIVAGPESTEQYERLASGAIPFFRRWSVGEGNTVPDALIFTDNATWMVNKQREFVRASGQTSQSRGDDIGNSLEDIDDWTGAWAAPMSLNGQKFIVLQAPYATNVYDTQGVTYVHDYRQNRWFNLYGWDDRGFPARWPGWSYYFMWDRHFVGGNGRVYELKQSTFDNGGDPQRVLARTAHFDDWGEVRCDNVRMRLKRGTSGSNTTREPRISVRAIRDNQRVTNWVHRTLGRAGDSEMVIEFGGFGCAHTWQFEWMTTDAVELEVVKLQADVMKIGRG
jgi:hypothetical protein